MAAASGPTTPARRRVPDPIDDTGGGNRCDPHPDGERVRVGGNGQQGGPRQPPGPTDAGPSQQPEGDQTDHGGGHVMWPLQNEVDQVGVWQPQQDEDDRCRDPPSPADRPSRHGHHGAGGDGGRVHCRRHGGEEHVTKPEHGAGQAEEREIEEPVAVVRQPPAPEQQIAVQHVVPANRALALSELP